MLIETKSPCIECEHHLAGGDKNIERCRSCTDRIVYDKTFGCRSESVPADIVLNGNGGCEIPEKNYPEVEPMALSAIRRICGAHGEDFENIRATSRYKNLKQSTVVDEIIACLAEDFNMNNSKIAKILDLTESAVYQRRKKIAEEKKDRPICQKPGKNTTLVIDFSGHPSEFEKLVKCAKTEMRSVENQLIYMVKSYPPGFFAYDE